MLSGSPPIKNRLKRRLIPISRRAIALCILGFWLLPAASSSADESGTYRITRERLDSATVSVEEFLVQAQWLYHEGDNPTWAHPDFDDSGWELLGTLDVVQTLTAGERSNFGWLRLHLSLDSNLLGLPLMLSVLQTGASEIYVDGKLESVNGKVGRTAEEEEAYVSSYPLGTIITFEKESEHLLAIRFSNSRAERLLWIGVPTGLGIEISDAEARIPVVTASGMRGRMHQMFYTGAAFIVAVIFLLLYLYYRRAREYLYFALFTFGCAMITFWPFEIDYIHNPIYSLTADIMFKVGMLMIVPFVLIFLYTLFYERTPRQFWAFVVITAIGLLLCWRLPQDVYIFLFLLALIETFRIVVLAVFRKRDGAVIIGVGFVIFAIGCTMQALSIWNIIGLPPDPFSFPYLAGTIVLLTSMAFYLARRSAKTNIELSHQLIQVKVLSECAVEQERKAKEQEMRQKLLEKDIAHQSEKLEEARKLEEAHRELEKTFGELRNTQAQLIQSEKMASLGMLVAGIAHEINTPLGASNSMHSTMMKAIKILKQAVKTDVGGEIDRSIEKALKVIDDADRVIRSGNERVGSIVKRLKSFARLDEAELKRVDIHEGIDDTLSLLVNELADRITVTVEYGKIPPLACFPGQLNQVFLNLLINASRAIDNTGEIKITTGLKHDQVFIRIEDTGCGIPPDKLDKVFDPGFTTKARGVGTGLGLSICYKIIQQHRGDIKVSSEVGRGSAFTVILPTNLDQLLPQR